jgi:hypothetical protein
MVGGERPGEVDELYAIDVFTGEVTPPPTWQIASVRHVIHPQSRAPYDNCRKGSKALGPNDSNVKHPLPMTVLQFAPFSSLVQPAFWQELTSLKIDVLQLSDDSVPVNASYALGKSIKDRETGKEIALGCNLTVGGGSFDKDSFQYAARSPQ